MLDPAARRLASALKHQIVMGADVATIHQAEKRAVALSADNPSFASAAIDYIDQYARKRTRRWQAQARLLGLRDANGSLELIKGGLASRWRDKPLTEIDDDVAYRVVEEARGIQ